MSKENFWIKLKKEEKLKLVEPSDEIKESYVKKSESNILAAKLLLENNMLEEAISITYYSMYNLLLALLFKTGIKSENHNASIILLHKMFNKDNNLISEAKKERIDKQYYVDFKITKSEVIDTIKTAEEFNAEMIDYLSRITNDELQEARKKFKQILDKK
ncbi:MAG: HEPN domain-containing protein [Nanoarchaeota archaeon]|nr:HEPN domain-containing protein [Nanoarchaeota archaeon]